MAHAELLSGPSQCFLIAEEGSSPMWLRVAQSIVLAAAFWLFASGVSAQITQPIGNGQQGGSQIATLEQQLINRLKATTADRQTYIKLVVQKTDTGELDQARVLAFERYAIRRNPEFPFPFFERAMRFEADRTGVVLPPVRMLANPANQPRPGK
jgi:hypothetical protein